MNYNDIDDVANLLMNLHFSGYGPFAELEACKNITIEKVNSRLAALREDSCALSVISPIA